MPSLLSISRPPESRSRSRATRSCAAHTLAVAASPNVAASLVLSTTSVRSSARMTAMRDARELVARRDFLRRVPAAAERAHEEDGGEETLADQLRSEPLRVEQLLLRDDHFERARHAAFVARVHELERAPRAFHRHVGLGRGALERREADDAVLRFLHRGEHHAAIVGDRDVIAGARRLVVALDAAAVEERLRKRDAGRPDETRHVEQRLRVAALLTGGEAEIDAGIERGVGDADLRV